MLLLFLDTETTGVNFSEDQIIELAGVIVDFDSESLVFQEISKFQSLVSLRQVMDSRITRITGITDLDLATAPNLLNVQEEWANWLDSFKEIQAIVGHSIDFDLKFLKKESWFLPEGIKVVDTLELAKIFLPHLSAVNLEFLKDKLNLSPKIENEGDGKNEENLPHRALFDTRMCWLLFENLIKSIPEKNLDSAFMRQLKSHFLQLDINFYTKQNLSKTKVDGKVEWEEAKSTLKIDFLGNPLHENLQTRINKIEPALGIKLVTEILNLDLPREFVLILLQFYILEDTKLFFPNYNLKLHTQGNSSYCFADIVCTLIETNQTELSTNDPQKLVLSPFENIITHIKDLADTTINFGKIANYLELYASINLHINKIDETTILVQKWIGAYEFLLIALHPFWVNNEFKYFRYLLNHETRVVATKFANLCELSVQLKNASFDYSNQLFKVLSETITNLFIKFNINENQDYTFRFFSNSLIASSPNQGFNLQNYFSDLFEKFPDIKIETYLTPESFSNFLELINLAELFEKKEIIVWYLGGGKSAQTITSQLSFIQNSDNQIKMQDFFNHLIEVANISRKSVVVLAGQNSTLKDAQKILTENFNVSEYLVLGESGSLTKLSSKIERGFVGLVVTKVGDIHFLIRQKNNPLFKEIWIANQPYLWVHPFWYKKAGESGNQEEFLSEMKKVYLESQINQISLLSKTDVYFIKSYNL